MNAKEYGTDCNNPEDVAFFYHILREHKPSPEQLAQIASPILAAHKVNYMEALMQAAHLLAVSASEIKAAKEHHENLTDLIVNPFGVDIPKPQRFPISFDEMLCLLMPKASKAERTRRFRAYLKVALAAWATKGRVADGKDDLTRAGEWIANTKQRDRQAQNDGLGGSIDDSEYFYRASHFRLWQKEEHSRIGRENRKGKKRTTKEKKV